MRVGDELRHNARSILARERQTHIDKAATLHKDALQQQRRAARLQQLGQGL